MSLYAYVSHRQLFILLTLTFSLHHRGLNALSKHWFVLRKTPLHLLNIVVYFLHIILYPLNIFVWQHLWRIYRSFHYLYRNKTYENPLLVLYLQVIQFYHRTLRKIHHLHFHHCPSVNLFIFTMRRYKKSQLDLHWVRLINSKVQSITSVSNHIKKRVITWRLHNNHFLNLFNLKNAINFSLSFVLKSVEIRLKLGPHNFDTYWEFFCTRKHRNLRLKGSFNKRVGDDFVDDAVSLQCLLLIFEESKFDRVGPKS